MNPLDIVIVVIVSFCLIRGLIIGLIRQLASIVGVLAGFFAGYTYYPVVSSMLVRWVADESYRNIAAFLTVFCLVFVAIILLAWVINYLMKVTLIGWVDRLFGVAFGGLKGILLVSVLLVVLTAFLTRDAALIKDSRLAPHVTVITENLAKVVSKDMRKNFQAKIKEYKEIWKIP